MRKRKTITTRNMKFTWDYLTGRSYVKGKGRRKKENVTPESIKRYNAKRAEIKLCALIDTNFTSMDWYLTFTFEDKVTFAEAKHHMQNMIKRMQRLYKKNGETLKYIYVVEGVNRVHFHMLINNAFPITTEMIETLWTHGYVDMRVYHGKAEDATALAAYLLKETKTENPEKLEVFKRRWYASTNLEKPKESTKTLVSNRWRDDIHVPDGYYLDKDSLVEGVNLEGYPYRFYRLIKLDPRRNRWKT